MTEPDPALKPLIERVRAAAASKTALFIQGGGTKAFYGEPPQGELFDVRDFSGISSYEPTELVVTARCGTPLAELEAALAEKGQCLPFEPPRFGASQAYEETDAGTIPAMLGVGPGAGSNHATVGGMVAAGLAGPARAASGSVRDYVLGATMLNGRAEVLTFGGQVMKNVAGYDLSRLLAGSLGILGVIAEVSLKVLPIAPARATLRFETAQADAIERVNRWGGKPLPINASAWWDGMLVVRLSGARAAVDAAVAKLGGEVVDPALADPFWDGLRDHTDEYFVACRHSVEANPQAALWRLSVPSTTPPIALDGDILVEWGGAQRWLCTALPAAQVRNAAAAAGGHATLFRSHAPATGVFAPLGQPLERIHRELKKAFDPERVFNPGRMYPDI